MDDLSPSSSVSIRSLARLIERRTATDGLKEDKVRRIHICTTLVECFIQ